MTETLCLLPVSVKYLETVLQRIQFSTARLKIVEIVPMKIKMIRLNLEFYQQVLIALISFHFSHISAMFTNRFVTYYISYCPHILQSYLIFIYLGTYQNSH